MSIVLYRAEERGKADFGWLQANFSFSFGSYFNPSKVQFGALRVLNDDTIAPAAGFGTHPHDNMEIITIPLEGGLRHKDSMENEGVIGFGEVQVMSAGTGILHSEMNSSTAQRAKTLQLWVFPEQQNVDPRYDQKAFDLKANNNQFVTLVTPHDQQLPGALWIYQQSWFSLGLFESGKDLTYSLKKKGNGVYLFLIEGSITLNGESLSERDAAGITDIDQFEIKTLAPAKILLVEVPMEI
jgi:quercetin 2,3-dioxygenase